MSEIALQGVVRLEGVEAPLASSHQFLLTPESRCFVGHFESAPIFPGVAHLALAVSAAGACGFEGTVLGGVRDVRFLKPLHPADVVEVSITADHAANQARFEIRCRGELATTGVLAFRRVQPVQHVANL